MSYSLTIGALEIVSGGSLQLESDLDCRTAKDWCMPSFVFSVEGQVQFREALDHLATCQRQSCRSLRARVFEGMTQKLKWLFNEECLLGCVVVQPQLYGSKRVSLNRKDFPSIAHHLARCPKESCAQLRRSVLLTIRDNLRPTPTTSS